jgi:hypothetical protein
MSSIRPQPLVSRIATVLSSIRQGALPGAHSRQRARPKFATKGDADMTKLTLTKAMASLSALLLATALYAQGNDATQPTAAASGNSKVRIVRLSQVRGEVQIKHEDSRAFDSAMANLPIVEQSRLRTGTGVAEVEFEDNSTLRLGPNSMVEFPQLERLPTGKTATTVHLIQGIAYISLLKTPGNEFTMLFGDRKLDLPPATHIRLQLDGSEARLAVLDGAVRVDGPSGPVDVAKKKTATFKATGDSQPVVAKDVQPDELDSWDHDAAGYHSRVASNSMLNSPYAYGSNDMSYYGSFADAGCGSMWRPYFASAAWDPFSNGAWAWYPSAGYSWVSPYPWGWTPYHYGTWSYCSGSGWGWMPGGMWNDLNNLGMFPSSYLPGAPVSAGSGIVAPHPPVHAPRPSEPSVTPVNAKPIIRSGVAGSDSFVFRKDSAGMGVPRDTLGHLEKFSHQAENRGLASTPVYMNVPASSTGRVDNGALLGATVHRGSPPQPLYQGGGAGEGGGGGSFGRSGSGPSPGARESSGSMNSSRPISPAPAPSPGASPHR